jgi:hypothetical protein
MPLEPGSSPAVISRNISELTHHGSIPRKHDQIVAIALSNADRHPRRDNGGGIAGDYIEPPAAQTHRGTGNSGGGVPGTRDNNLLQPGPEGAVVGSRPIPGTHDRNSFSNPNDVAPYNPPGVEDDRRHGLAFGGLAHGDPLGGLAKPHPVKIGTAPAPTAMTGHVNMHPQNFMRFNAKQLGAFADGGAVYPDMPFEGGLIGGSGGGRTDRLPLSVPNDSHVLTADSVSGAGQGHTAFGARALTQALRIGPYDTPVPAETHGKGPPRAPEPAKSLISGESKGGEARGHGGRVGILAASGEMVIPAEDWPAKDEVDGKVYMHRGVRSLGRDWYAHFGGNPTDGQVMKKGHDLLDQMMAHIREFNIKWLKNAPRPKKSDGGGIGLAVGGAAGLAA